MSTYAKIIADSMNPWGERLTTMEVRIHRFMLPEFNTHRVLSKNSASSRAIPVNRQIARLLDTPCEPVSWPLEQKGMQGGDELSSAAADRASDFWDEARGDALFTARKLIALGVHKSVVNRLLEPFMWHTVVVTGTAWTNFFKQRISPLAQPEIQEVAMKMFDAYCESNPDLLKEGQWHLPYVDPEEVDSAWTAVKVSAARCARVSYLTQDGKRDIEADLYLYERLTTAKPAHWSPLEHVATPWNANRQSLPLTWESDLAGGVLQVNTDHLPVIGNLLGWRSLRTEVEAAQQVKTYV